MSTYECRKKAGEILKGRYAESIFVVMVCITVYLIFKIYDIVKIIIMLYNNTDATQLFITSELSHIALKYFSGVILFAVMTPLLTGGLWWFYQTACGYDNKSILKLYTGFKLNFRAGILYLIIWLVTMLSFLPTGVCWAASWYLFGIVSQFNNQTVVLFICLQLFMMGLFLTGLYFRTLSTVILSPFIFLKNPDMNVFRILNISRKTVYGSKLSALKLIVTYALQMLPIITIPFVLPKAIMSVSVFACDRIGEKAWEN